jgi:hypothetical protein
MGLQKREQTIRKPDTGHDIEIAYLETAKLELLLKMWKREATPLPQS